MTDPVVIERRFRGPPASGNGGYTCGRVASLVGGPAAVVLRAPPPLDTPLRVEQEGDVVRLLHGARVIAEGRPDDAALDVSLAPSFAEAEAAAKAYPGFDEHVFPGCFVCGPERAPGDGMRVFAGPLEGGMAAPWVPDASLTEAGSVRPEFLWAALDCPTAFASGLAPAGRVLVLGAMRGRVEGSVRTGERCVVAAWPVGADGRKRFAGSAIYTEDGAIAARALATWVEVDGAAFDAR